jgi:hypothetical protein
MPSIPGIINPDDEKPFTSQDIMYLASEVSHDVRCHEPSNPEDKVGINRIRWNNRGMARAIATHAEAFIALKNLYDAIHERHQGRMPDNVEKAMEQADKVIRNFNGY